jgi:DNA-binding NarL/FixJ family response regulator
VRASGVGAGAAPRLGRAGLLLVEGHWAEVHELAMAAHPERGWIDRAARGCLGLLAREQGDRDLGWRLVREALPGGPATAPGDSHYLQALQTQRLAAALALDAGDLATARAWLESHDRWLAWNGAVLGQAAGQLGWAEYYRAAGDPALARQHAERALALAGEPRQPLALLAAHRLLGELAAEAGKHAEAQDHLGQALALAEACAAPYEQALTLLALAELRHAASVRDAAAALDEARAVFARLEAKPALARAEALAARLAASQSPREGYPSGLTAREVAVLRLVAEGLTNAEVAERLYLSPRTVNAYLTTIYTKLGVASRGGAIRFALEHRLG